LKSAVSLMLVFAVAAAFCGNLVPSGSWTMERDTELNGAVRNSENSRTLSLELTSNEDRFFATYSGISNDAVMLGRAYTSERHPGQVLVTFTQYDTDFYATFVGHLENGYISGTWFTASGNSGDFTMRR